MKITRRLIDREGNAYVFEIPDDINNEVVTDILNGIGEGICKLLSYRLVADNVWRSPDNQPVEDNSLVKKYNFVKKQPIFDDESVTLSAEEFGTLMKEAIDRARESFNRINKPRVTHFEGHLVLEDSRGFYVKREIPCAAEGHTDMIKGTQRLSKNEDGQITRAQQFVPDQKGCQRARAGSRLWLCPGASVKHVPVENKDTEVKENIAEAHEVALQPEKNFGKTNEVREKESGLKGILGGQDLLLVELMAMTSPTSETPAEYVKGFAHAVAAILTGGMKEVEG